MYLRPGLPDDCRRVWEWVNDPLTRRQSFSADEIPWQEHVRWFDEVLAEDRRILLIACDPSPVGMARFDLDDGSATISVNLAPEARGRGLGTVVIDAATTWLHERWQGDVIARIKPTNTASIRAFTSAGFTLRRTDADAVVYGRRPGPDPSAQQS